MNVLGLMLSVGAVTFGCAFPQMKGSCKIPPRLEHMELLGASVQESFPMGHVVHYTCRPGYSRYGATIKMICSEGTWLQVSRGECKKKRCGNPGDIEFGTFELKNEEDFVFGAIVEYSCEPGYQMVSKYNSIECTAGGWSRDLPHCEAKLCPPVVDDSVRVLSTIHDEEYTAGHVINLKCKNPKKKLNGPSQIHCTSNGTWNIDPPTCKEPCAVSYSKMKQHNIQVKNYQIKHNELITFECIPRYEILDHKNLFQKCNDGVITYPTCHLKAKLCPPVVDDSVRVLSTIPDEEYTAGHVINLECKNPNKKLNGPSQIYCTSNGAWNIEPPTCKAKLCPPVVDDSVRVLSTIPNEEYTAGHVINLKCKNPNKKLNGPSQIHCTSNGTWNVDPPTCKEQKLKKQPCFPPPEVLFGEWMRKKKEMYDSGSTIKFKCISYYKLQGKKEIKCRNGTWDQLPACLVPCILNSNYIKGNNTDLVNAKEKYVEHNKNVKFKCLRTFAISDVKLLHVKCLNGTLEYPKCVKMEPCVLNDNYLKGNNTIVNASKKYLEHDETVKFKCLPTFNISDSKLLNGKCLDGKLKYPKCVKMAPDAITVQPSVQSEPNIY